MKEKIVMRVIVGLLTLILIAPVLSAASDEEERIANGAGVMQEILNIPDGLPKELLNKAEIAMIGTTGSAPTSGTSTSGINAPVP